MIMEKVNILNVPFVNISPQGAVNEICAMLSGEGKHTVFTPNPEMVMLAQKDTEFCEILNKSDMNIPDGIGIIYASKIKKCPIKERVAGYDTVQGVFERINKTGQTVYMFGGAPGVTDAAKAEMERKHSGLKIVGCANGYFDEKREREIIEEINTLKPDLLLVGIGFPKQEKWIYNNLPKLNCKVAVGVGGSFDVMSGRVKRAPEIFIKLGLEWFHRLITQPSRFVRMLQLPLFMLKVIFSK
jgi:N-acetylglucosaminyldiphosphoundecaprenol N-acetyl-beta-D-mannosaminyltransferase